MKIKEINNHKDIPSDYYCIRVVDKVIYLHIDDQEFYFEERMTGCFVAQKKDAKKVKDLLMEIIDNEYIEMVNFHDAYEEHGLVEKQICYN